MKNASSKELIGMLQAIAVVADNLASRLMKLDREVERREMDAHCRGQSYTGRCV